MVPCPICSMPIALSSRGVEETVFCTGCRRDVTVVAWPALDGSPGRWARPQPAGAGEALCFSCADKAATGVCDGCGCFTCPACEAAWFGESLCLTCLHARRELQAAPRYRHRIVVHDNVAFALVALPFLLIPFYGVFFSVLASPVALFLIVRHRRAPRGLPPRGPFRLILTGVLAVLLLLGAAAGIGAVVYAIVGATQSAERAAEEITARRAVVDPRDSDASVPEDGDAVPEEGETQ